MGIVHFCDKCNQTSRASPGTLGPLPAGKAHDGQRRAHLRVKDRGFTLGNFARASAGRLEDAYRVERQSIGEGAFGTVQRACDRRTDVWRCVKKVPKGDGEELRLLREEVEILCLLDHPNVVRLVEIFEDAEFVYLVLELCEGGELFHRIAKLGKFTEAIAAICMRQMLLALNYIHQNSIMHRDLKPENWLVQTKGEIHKGSTLKLIDFGLSRRFKGKENIYTKLGTPLYIAPEVLAGVYDYKADLWSTGVIMHLMLSGSQPFEAVSTEGVLRRIQTADTTMDGPRWSRVSGEAKGLIALLLTKNPAERPSAAQALQHSWLHLAEAKEDVAESLTKLEVGRLKAFSRMNRLKKAALTVIAVQLDNDSISGLRDKFMAMDKNQDGTLSFMELRAGLKQAGVAIPGNLEELFREVDTDGSGALDYTEFLAATLNKKVFHQEDVVWHAFKKFDLDSSGAIEIEELQKVLGDAEVRQAMHLQKDERLEKVFAAIDSNHDGVIDFGEFFKMLRAKGSTLTQSNLAPAATCDSPKIDDAVATANMGCMTGTMGLQDVVLTAPSHYIRHIGEKSWALTGDGSLSVPMSMLAPRTARDR